MEIPLQTCSWRPGTHLDSNDSAQSRELSIGLCQTGGKTRACCFDPEPKASHVRSKNNESIHSASVRALLSAWLSSCFYVLPTTQSSAHFENSLGVTSLFEIPFFFQLPNYANSSRSDSVCAVSQATPHRSRVFLIMYDQSTPTDDRRRLKKSAAFKFGLVSRKITSH